MAEATRSYRPWESKLVYEWAIKNFPNSLQWRKARVGPLPNSKDSTMYSQLRRWADLIVVNDDEILLIEAKIAPDPGALSQLELYAKLFPSTPEFRMVQGKPVRLVFLTTKLDKAVKELAEEKNITYEIYCPKWIQEYWAQKLASS